jgi:hypothetical protein
MLNSKALIHDLKDIENKKYQGKMIILKAGIKMQ